MIERDHGTVGSRLFSRIWHGSRSMSSSGVIIAGRVSLPYLRYIYDTLCLLLDLRILLPVSIKDSADFEEKGYEIRDDMNECIT